ncbi:MAG: hypothetical protein ACXWLR_15665 [Myxococcales bacterium]
MRVPSKLVLSVLLAANVARAQAPSTDAAAKPEATPSPAPAADAQPAAQPKSDAPARPYVDSALTFLTALTHANRPGDAGAKAWADLRTVSVEKVPLKFAGKDLVIDATAGHSDAVLVRYSKVSTWREALDVQGVTIEKAQLRVGDQDYTGKARLKLSEKNGKWVVESFEVE